MNTDLQDLKLLFSPGSRRRPQRPGGSPKRGNMKNENGDIVSLRDRFGSLSSLVKETNCLIQSCCQRCTGVDEDSSGLQKKMRKSSREELRRTQSLIRWRKVRNLLRFIRNSKEMANLRLEEKGSDKNTKNKTQVLSFLGSSYA